MFALCPYSALFVNNLVALRPVGADGDVFAGGILAEVKLVLGDGEVVLTVVDDLIDLTLVPDDDVVSDVDRLGRECFSWGVCTRAFDLGDVEAVAVVTQYV